MIDSRRRGATTATLGSLVVALAVLGIPSALTGCTSNPPQTATRTDGTAIPPTGSRPPEAQPSGTTTPPEWNSGDLLSLEEARRPSIDDGSGGNQNGPPTGVEVGGPTVPQDSAAQGSPPAPPAKTVEGVVDPCKLLPLRDWRDWTGDAAAGTFPLQDAGACAYVVTGDTLRLAIGLEDADGAGRWLDSSPSVQVDGIGYPARWLAGQPVAQSSTLVVELPHADLVIELSSRSPDNERLLGAAKKFAASALSAIPTEAR